MSIQSSNTPAIGQTAVNQPAKQPTADDVLDLLSREDETPPDKVDKDKIIKDKDKEKIPSDDDISLKEDIDEVDKLELEDEEDKDKKKDKDKDKIPEEELELDAPPKKRELLAKYPDLFKNFPWFEKMMYRDRQYTELFGSFDDAKDVAEKAQVLDSFEQDLMGGNTETILKQIKDNDPKAFDKIVDNYLIALSRVDKDAYVEVCGNIGKHIIHDLVKEAEAIGGTNKDQAELLRQTALILNQYLFASSTYTPPKPRVEQKSNEAEEEINNQKKAFARERYEASRNELQTRVDNTLRATISDYIDRNNEMTPYVKKNAINDAMNLLHKTVGGDVAFRKSLDRLWEAAFNNNFSQDSLNSIKSAYLGRSKQILKAVIQKARADALKDNTAVSRQREDEEEREEERPRRGPIASGRPRQSSGKNERKQGESVTEFFMRD